jgi:hypothetical protein
MTIKDDDVNTIASGGGEVRTSHGDKVGKIGQVYLDDDSGRPSWVTVKTGLFGTQESFVPLPSADLDGVDVVVPYDKETIKGAPRVDSDVNLTPQEEKLLYSYYFEAPTLGEPDEHRGAADEDTRPSTSRVERTDQDRDDNLRHDLDRDDNLRHDRDRDDDLPHDRDRDHGERGDHGSGEDAVSGGAGSGRLRRYVVTEKVVPVSREEVPVDDSDR